ncbi:hypothetical protein ACFMQL_20335 [Nonomuraea fastidiosa]|uniref:hypothetical protein n=1 Tax=Nonomuraea fastidiosa TaxID=46173 RepID=UPI003670F661
MLVPLDHDGSLIRHPHRYPNPDEIVWEEAKPFRAFLVLQDTTTAQGYGKYVTWRELHGVRRWPMDTEPAFAAIKHLLIDHGVIVADQPPLWTFTKSPARGGEAYGIKLVRRRFLEQEGDDTTPTTTEENR